MMMMESDGDGDGGVFVLPYLGKCLLSTACLEQQALLNNLISNQVCPQMMMTCFLLVDFCSFGSDGVWFVGGGTTTGIGLFVVGAVTIIALGSD